MVIKRDGSKEEFNRSKIRDAVLKAIKAVSSEGDYHYLENIEKTAEEIADSVTETEDQSIENIQDQIEELLMDYNLKEVAKKYIIYRYEHSEGRDRLSRLNYMEDYKNNGDNAATSSNTDPNANSAIKNVASLEAEVYKAENRLTQRQRMKDMLNKLYPEVAKQYEEDLNNHIIYTNDEASTPVPKFYCQAVSLYPMMLEGVGNIDGVTPGPPNDLESFSGQLTNLTFTLSSQCKGAVAFGSYFVALNYYTIAEFGPKWYEKINLSATSPYVHIQRTIKDRIHKAFGQFVWGINQPAGNRSYQSPFTNISYYDHTYFDSLFGEFTYPDGTKPAWQAIDTLQRMFMVWFNQLRTKAIVAFPVETMAMVYDPETNDIIDKEYKDLTAEMYARGHSFFTYISDSADSLASCCFSKDTKFLWKSSTAGVNLTTFEEFIKLPYTGNKENLKIFHNGSWVGGKVVTLPNRPMYKVTTYNNKEFIMTDNHINVTLHGEKPTEQLTTDDYLLFNTSRLSAIPENNEHLTYAQGYVIGSFLGDGSFGSEIKGTIYDINLSQNEQKYKRSKFYWNLALRQMGLEQRMVLGEIINNVYPLRVSSKELVAFIIKWTNWFRGTYAYNKKLNMNALLQSVKFREGILQGWYDTDGGNSNRCYTTSPELAENMEALITSLGMQSIIDISDRTDEKVIIRGEEYKRNYPLYCVRWYEDANHRLNKDKAHSWIKFNNGIYFRIKSIEKYDYSDKVYCIECKNASEPYFTLPSGLITHNCRLRNKLGKNTFNPTSGLTGVQTGSCNVITLNISRIVQDWIHTWSDWQDHIVDGKCAFPEEWTTHNDFKRGLKEYLINILERVYKYHIAYKTILYDWEDAGMFTCCNAGYIHMKKLYSTIGVNGLNEAARFLGLTPNKNDLYIQFLQLILGTIKEQNALHSIQDKKRPFLMNSECVPAEGLGGKNYNWDKKDGYWVPDDVNLYNSYFFIQSDPNISVLDKMYLHGRSTYQYTDGGSACHINLSDHLSKEQYLKLLDYAIKEGTSYFTFNIPNSRCKECGFITKHPIKECPKCHSTNIDWYSRVIGYLRPIKLFGMDRQIEAGMRVYSSPNSVK